MKITLAHTVLSICFWLPLVATAQTSTSGSRTAQRTNVVDIPLRFNRLSLDEGLSQGRVLDILQDHRGFMWFATEDGLNRYDGYSFTVYNSVPFDSTSLSDPTINSLYEDRSGTLWVGTAQGLDRMNSATGTFIHFDHDPVDTTSLSNGNILDIYEDRSGTLWVGTERGLNKLIRESGRFTRYPHRSDDPSSLSNDQVHDIYEDRAGTLWVSTANGLNRFDPVTGTFQRFFYDPNARNEDLGSISVGTPGDVNVRQSIMGRMCEDPDLPGVLWIASAGGLIRFDIETDRHRYYVPSPDDPARSIAMDVAPDPNENGVLWVTTNGGGLYRFDVENQQFISYRHDPGNPNSLHSNDIFPIYVDRTGLVWVGSYDSGLNAFDPDVSGRFAHYHHVPGDSHSLSDNMIWALYEDQSGMLWIGTNSGGLNRLDRTTGRFTRYILEPGPTSMDLGAIYAINQDPSGALWVATSRILYKLDPHTRKVLARYALDRIGQGINIITQLYWDRSGAMWIGGRGLYRIPPEAPGVIASPLSNPADPISTGELIYDIHEDISDNKTLWVATADGLDSYDTRTGKFTRYRHHPLNPNSLSNDFVISIHERRREPGVLWIGTIAGLNRYDTRTDTFTLYSDAAGLANNTAYGILEDEDGRLWISTNRGLSRFDPSTGEFRNYDVDRGVQSKEFNSLAYFISPRTGEMFFGGINGFNAFHPGQITGDPTPPEVAFTGFQVFNQHIEPGPDSPLRKPIFETEDIRLNHDQNSVTFEFVALHFKNPKENQYAYMLENYDADWVQAGTQHTARYAKLPPGAYTFRVKAANSDGVWNEQGASISVTILPPWWRTWWAYALYVLLGVGAAVAASRIQHQRIVWNERQKAMLRERELRAEAAEHLANYLQSENDRQTQELEHARQLQLSMLPRTLPKHSKVDIAAHMQTATEVGGDYYDFALSDNGTLTFAIGDATGHGVQAGTMVTAMKSLWNAFADESDLEAVMHKSSEALKRLHLPKLYMALAFGRLEDDMLELVGAGMPPALIFRDATGDIEEVPLKGMPLGSPGKHPYKRHQIKLAPGDTVVLMSDGFPELRDESGEMLGYERMPGIVAEVAGRSPEEVIMHFTEIIQSRCNGRAPGDDVTCVVLRAKTTIDMTRSDEEIDLLVSREAEKHRTVEP